MNELNGLHIAVLIVTGLILLILLLYLFHTRTRGRQALTQTKKDERNNIGNPLPRGTKPCPLCREPLPPGERVHSVLYPGKPDSLMEIFGCPHCETAPGGRARTAQGNTRTCPVCKKEMPQDAVLIARVFEKPGKKHVHVLGCSNCYSGRSKIRPK